jgi:predicted MFS family arabinose efflux permease
MSVEVGSAVSQPVIAQGDETRPARPIWRNGSFLVVIGGQWMSNAGGGATQIALPLLILALTGSPLQASLFAALRLGLYALAALPAGVLVDHVRARRLMMTCDVWRALLLVSVPIAAFYGLLTIGQLYGVVACEAVLWTMFDLAANKLVPSLVDERQVRDAAGTMTTVNNAQQFVGQPLGAALMQFGRFIPFGANALTYLVSAISLVFVREPAPRDVAPTTDPPAPVSEVSVDAAPAPNARSAARGLFSGFRWLLRHRLLRALALACSLANVALAGYTLLLLVILRTLDATPAEISLTLLAAGVGSLVGPIVCTVLCRKVPALAVFLVALPVEAGLWLATLYAAAPFTLAALALCTMTADQAFNTAQFATRMRVIPEDMRGRGQSAYRLFLTLSQPIGLTLMGWGLQSVGLSLTILGGVAIILVAWALAIAEPAVRRDAQIRERPGLDLEVVTARRLALGPPQRMWSVDAWVDAVGANQAPAFFTGTLARRAAAERGAWTGVLTGPLKDVHPTSRRERRRTDAGVDRATPEQDSQALRDSQGGSE